MDCRRIGAALILVAGCSSSSRDDSFETGTSITSTTGTVPSEDTDADSAGGTTSEDKLDIGYETTGDTGSDLPVGCDEIGSTASNQGCEFWAVDLPNAWTDPGTGEPGPEDHQFAIVVANTSGNDATVTIYAGTSTAPADTATVAVGDTHEFRLPAANIEPRANSTDGVAWRVESDEPITAYQFNPLDNTLPVYSNDASLLFPTHVLGDDYTAITGDGLNLNTGTIVDNAGSYVSAVATADDTTITIFPTKPIYAGATTVTINRGQVATWISNDPPPLGNIAGQGNLSGSRVSSDKPIAVFSGNVATIEPLPGQCCADHLEHQMLPLVAWGTGYLAAPAAPPTGFGAGDPAGFRITGAFDGTQLVYNPIAPAGAPTTINAGQTVRFESGAPFTVTTTDENKPFALTQFLQSSEWLVAGGQMGDPAMIAIPATAQFQGRYIVLAPNGYTTNFVTVYRPTMTDVYMDDEGLTGESWHPLGALDGTGWEYAHVAVTPGSHTFRADPEEVGIGVVSTGYSDWVSYGYPGGSGLAIISEAPPPAG